MKRLLTRPISLRQRRYLIALFLVGVLLPTILSTLLMGLGQVLGCQMFGKTQQICSVGGMSLGQMIKTLISWNWALTAETFFVISPFSIIAISAFIGLLALIYTSYNKQKRTILGVCSIYYFWVFPMFPGIFFVVWATGLAQDGQCPVNAGGVGDCYLMGIDMEGVFHSAAIMPFMLFLLFPITLVLTVIYLVVSTNTPDHL